jgi:hypothetical protein
VSALGSGASVRGLGRPLLRVENSAHLVDGQKAENGGVRQRHLRGLLSQNCDRLLLVADSGARASSSRFCAS